MGVGVTDGGLVVPCGGVVWYVAPHPLGGLQAVGEIAGAEVLIVRSTRRELDAAMIAIGDAVDAARPEPAPPPVWEREEDCARDNLAAAAPEMKRAGDALEALLVDDYWQSDRLAAARDAWRAASIKAEGGGE